MELSESVIDWRQDNLDSFVWQQTNENYILNPSLRLFILNKLLPIKDTIKDVFIVGSITTHYYNNKTDIDVHILPSPTINMITHKQHRNWLEQIDDKIPGSTHILQFYLHAANETIRSIGIYDILKNKWIKRGTLQHVNIKDYQKEFRKIVDEIDLDRMELYRDLIDFKELKKAYRVAAKSERIQIENETEEKVKEINKDIDKLIDEYEGLKDRRTQALMYDFSKASNLPESVKKYKLANLLPDAVIYKLCEKYHYKTFLKHLKIIKKESDKIDDLKGVDKILEIY